MRNLRHLIRHAGLLSSDKRRRRSEKFRRSGATQRRLSNEALEKRELLAGDIQLVEGHNYWNRYDVNDDGNITARDALGVINYMDRAGEGELQGDGLGMFYDVNGDSNITAADALGVINAINRGEEVGELIELILTARDDNDNLLSVDGSGDINVEVGEIFNLEVSYDDLRVNPLFGPEIELGAFQLYTDIAVGQTGVLTPVLNETQRIRIGQNVTEMPFASSVLFGIEGSADTYNSDFTEFFTNTEDEFAAMLNQLGGYTPDQYMLTEFTYQNGDLGYQIHWLGDEFGNVDLPDLTIDVIENGGDPVETEVEVFDAFLPDGVTPNGEAVRFNLNTYSRTYNPTLLNPQGEQFYASQNRGDFDSTGFVGVGGLGQVPIDGGGVPDLTDDGSFEQPFDTVSMRVFINQPVTDLKISVNPGEADEATLLYGRDNPLPQDMVLIDDTVDTNNNDAVSFVTINATGDTPLPGALAIEQTATVDEDAGTVTLIVTRSGGSDGSVTVDYASANGTATAGEDYTAINGTLTFADGVTSQTITVPITDDTIDESDEDFTVSLSNVGGGATLGNTVATVTIVDNDNAGTLSIASTATVNEDDETVAVVVTRTGGSDGEVTVQFDTADGTAIAPSDYTAQTGQTLTFGDGVTSQTINIPIIDDSVQENNEEFTITLTNATGGATIGTATSIVTIVDDDNPGELAIQSTAEVVEGAGTVTLIVSRTGGSDGEVSVDFATVNGNATAGEDYTSNSGTLTFADGDTTKSVVIAILDDNIDEPNEDFTVGLSNVVGATLGNDSATVTIVDDDNAGVLSIASTASVNENDGTVQVTVTRTGGSDGEVSVTFNTADGTAVAGSDYTAQSGQTLTFANGVTSQTISIPILDDMVQESDEDFTISLSNPTGGAILGNSLSTVTIVDDDNPGELNIAATAQVDEDAGTVTVTVSRVGGSTGAVSVDFTTSDNTAIAGSDYESNSGTLNFADGDTSKDIVVNILDDQIEEATETFNIVLSNVGGEATLGNATSIVTINDDDSAGTLAIQPTATVDEKAGTVTLTVSRTDGSDGQITVDFETINGTATGGQDYASQNGTLTFPDGETSQNIIVAITDDTDGSEADEQFTVVLSNPSVGVLLGNTTATVTIENVNESPVAGDNIVVEPRTEDDLAFTVSEAELLANSSDREDSLSVGVITLVSGDDRGVTVNANSIDVNPGAYEFLVGGESATIIYQYNVLDGVNAPVSQTATITITGINDPPNAEDDTAVAFVNTTSVIDVLQNDDAGGGEDQSISIISASSPNGTTNIVDGGIEFTPTLDFEGQTTITYTIQDAQGATDTATVNVTVQDFNPTSITGSIFIDHVENFEDVINGNADPFRDGVKDDDEQGIGASEVVLTSSAANNVTGQDIRQVVLTNAEGLYAFDNLAPGHYEVTYDVPEELIFVGVEQKVVTIEAPGGVDVNELNFPVLGTQGSALDNVDILASSYLRTNATIMQMSDGGREGGTVLLEEDGAVEFIVLGDGYENIVFGEFTLNDAKDSALLTILEEDGDLLSATLNTDHFVLSEDGCGVQFFGGMNDLNFVESTAAFGAEYDMYRDAVDRFFGIS